MFQETQIPSRREVYLGEEERRGGVGEGRGVHQRDVLHQLRLGMFGTRSRVLSRPVGDGKVEVLTDGSDEIGRDSLFELVSRRVHGEQLLDLRAALDTRRGVKLHT